MSTDTACSSSLVAAHMAAAGLEMGQSPGRGDSAALAGGTNVMLLAQTSARICLLQVRDLLPLSQFPGAARCSLLPVLTSRHDHARPYIVCLHTNLHAAFLEQTTKSRARLLAGAVSSGPLQEL